MPPVNRHDVQKRSCGHVFIKTLQRISACPVPPPLSPTSTSNRTSDSLTMANTGLPSASGPLDSQGHSLPLLSRSTVLPYSAQSTDLGTIDISSDECEVVKPPKKKLRKTDLSLPRKGKEQAMVRHLPRFFFFLFRSDFAWYRVREG